MKERGISYPNIKQSWGIVGICILSMILFSPVSILLNIFTGKEISFLIYYLLSMGATFWIAHLKRRKWTDVDEYNFAFSSAKIAMLVSLAVIAIQLGIVSPVVSLIPMPEFMKDIVLEFAMRNGIFSFIAIVIAAPVLEELIFRGIILNGLLKRYSPLKSIVISSILFGVVHLNPWQFVAAFVIGIFSGWVYYKTKKLTLCILIHF
jgi:membrane protease YdiL (CAAX protease family)